MILTDILPVRFICNLYLVITKTQARMMPGAESKTPFPDLVTHHPKVVLASGSVDSPKPQNLTECLKNRIPEDPEG